MSTSTILAIFALIIAASCFWMVYLAIVIDRQNKVISESFSHVMDWMEKQEQAQENWTTAMSDGLEILETRLPEFDWEDPNG